MASENDIVVDYGSLAGCSCPICASAAAGDAIPAEQTALSTSQPYDDVPDDEDQGVDGLLSGQRWQTTELTFSFPDSPDDYGYDFYGEASTDFSPFNDAQKAAVREALAEYASFSTLRFTELEGEADREADLTFAESGRPSTAWAYFPSSGDWGGDAWFNRTDFNEPEPGSYAWATILHEIGHSVGLKHGHDATGPGALPDDQDSHEFSLMTYRSHVGSTAQFYSNGEWSGPQTPMMLDIAAVQRMYGANFDHAGGDTVYTFSTETGQEFIDGVGAHAPGDNYILRTIWDGGGVDTYDFSNYATDLAIDLAPGGYVDLDVGGFAQRADLGDEVYARGHVFNALQFEGDARSLIENAIGGSGNDLITGNAADNDLIGGEGRDTLQGLAGDDTLTGGAAADVFVFDRLAAAPGDADVIGDLVFEDGDTISLTGFAEGTFSGLDLIGGVSANGAGAVFASYGDLYDLSTLAFADISELADGGSLISFFDDLWSSSISLLDVSYELIVGESSEIAGEEPDPEEPDPVEEEPEEEGETGEGDGGEGDPTGEEPPEEDGTGETTIEETDDEGDVVETEEDDRPTASRGDDDMAGGDGDDSLEGLGGADTITGGRGDDTLDGGGGSDELWGGGGADLLRGGQRRDLMMGGGGDDTLEGGAGRDSLYGAGGADRLEGGGFMDTLSGGFGADTLLGQGGADSLEGGGGRDILRGGGRDDTLDGGRGADLLSGGDGDDLLLGRGGDDTLRGGVGDDWLSGGGGSDLINAGSGDDTLSGNGGDDTLNGHGGADQLNGGDGEDVLIGGGGADTLSGGAGDDMLTGGAGPDVFIFVEDGGDDVILDWTDGEDLIDFEAASGVEALTILQNGADVIIFTEGASVTVLNAAADDFDEADFLF